MMCFRFVQILGMSEASGISAWSYFISRLFLMLLGYEQGGSQNSGERVQRNGPPPVHGFESPNFKRSSAQETLAEARPMGLCFESSSLESDELPPQRITSHRDRLARELHAVRCVSCRLVMATLNFLFIRTI